MSDESPTLECACGGQMEWQRYRIDHRSKDAWARDNVARDFVHDLECPSCHRITQVANKGKWEEWYEKAKASDEVMEALAETEEEPYLDVASTTMTTGLTINTSTGVSPGQLVFYSK